MRYNLPPRRLCAYRCEPTRPRATRWRHKNVTTSSEKSGTALFMLENVKRKRHRVTLPADPSHVLVDHECKTEVQKLHAKKTLPLMHAPLCVFYYYFEENYGSPWATWTLLINRQTYYRVIILGIDLIRVAARAQKRKRRKIRKNKEIYALYICTALQSGSEDQIDFFFSKMYLEIGIIRTRVPQYILR